MNGKMVLLGAALMGVGIAPTPDDVTVISPLLQIGVGAVLVVVGLFSKGGK